MQPDSDERCLGSENRATIRITDLGVAAAKNDVEEFFCSQLVDFGHFAYTPKRD